ncbi:unnamed protein product [Lymnaea stagnalis]|uniref:G-protein coupled receptors family 1 profile domain-containing protein n=1 Tax=Lymnaea stagnalis TaxID=6523 RepID=A0AAV2HEH4_LYMST
MHFNDTSTTAHGPELNSSGSPNDGTWMNNSGTDPLFPDQYGEPINKVVITIAFSSVFVLCAIGNSIVLFVLTRSTRSRSRTNLFLANLAAADLFVGLFCILPTLFRLNSSDWTHGRVICKMNKFVESVNVTASMLLLEVIAVERYIVIKHPLKARSLFTLYRMYFAQFFVWLVSCAYNAPYLLMWDTIHTVELHGNQLVSETNCLFQNEYRESVKIYYICSFVVWYALPLLVMSLLYGKIARTLWKTSAQNDMLALRKRISSAASEEGGETTGSTLASSQTSDPTAQSPPPVNSACCNGKGEGGDDCPKGGGDVAGTRNTSAQAAATHSGRQAYTWTGGGTHAKNGFVKANGSSCGSGNGKAAFLKDRHHITRSTSDSDSDDNSSDNPVFDSRRDDGASHRSVVRKFTRQNGRSTVSVPASSRGPEDREAQTSGANHCRYRVTSQRATSRRRVIRLLLAVLITFALLVLPNHLRLIIMSMTSLPGYFAGQAFIAPICQTLLYLNSAMNPILYCLLSQSFRQSIREAVSCCFSWRRKREQMAVGRRVKT